MKEFVFSPVPPGTLPFPVINTKYGQIYLSSLYYGFIPEFNKKLGYGLKTLYLSLYTLLYSRWRYAVISIKDKKKKMLSCSFCRKHLASALFFATIAVV